MTGPTVIVWDDGGRLATEARIHLDSTPVKIVEVNDEDDFREALHAATSSLVLLDRATVGERLADAVSAASASEALIVVVGRANADEWRRDRDLGVHLLLGETPSRIVWGGTLRRLARIARQRLLDSTSSRST